MNPTTCERHGHTFDESDLCFECDAPRPQIKPSELCKAAGLKSLNELAEITGESVQTLNNWHKNKPRLFHAVLMGAIGIRGASRVRSIGGAR